MQGVPTYLTERVSKTQAQKHAVVSAYLSILVGLAELFFSLLAGENEDSTSIYGIAAMALADTFGSMLVVWRWQFTSKNAKPSDLNIQEARCSMMVAAGMILSAAMLLNSSIDGLVKRDSPDGASEAFLVSCVTFFASFTLYIYKDLVGRILCSIVVISDARSSLCSGLVALAVISSEFLEKWWWWADNVMGLALGFYICFQAYTTIAEAQLILQDPDKSDDGSLDTPAEKEHLLFPSKDTDGGGNSKQYDIEKRKTKGARQNAKEADSSASTLPAT